MEASAVAAGVAARGISLPVSQAAAASRKEWRAVSDQSVRNSSGEEIERSRLGQSDERLIYEVQQGREPVDVDFCSITIDERSDNDILQQRLHSVVKQKQELQQMEIELRAQLIARSEIMELQNSFDAQIKDQANANAKLQEQIHERDQKIYELERRMEEKERELHAIRLDNEAAWAKEDLLREQSKELQTYRRERDNSEAERSQHIKQIHDLQEHIQEKERQFLELQEQNRIAQETVLFKDEQIREAQAWMTRVQEVDVLQQAELRERAEQYNQLWLGYQRQFGEMERLHMHIQQLQLELEARGGTQSDRSKVSQLNSNDASHLGQSSGSQLNVSGNSTPGESSMGLQNGNAENATSFASMGNVSTQSDHVHGMPVAPTSLLGMATYLPPGQITALHPYVMHQQGIPSPLPSHVPQSHIGHFHPVAAVSSLQHWPNQQAVSEGSQISSHTQYTLQPQSTLPTSDAQYDHETHANGQTLRSYGDVNINQGIETQDPVVPASNEEGQERQSMQTLHQISSQFNGALRLDSDEQNNKTEVKDAESSANYMLDSQGLKRGEFSLNADKSSVAVPNNVNNSTESVGDTVSGAVLADTHVTGGPKNAYVVGKSGEVNLLDEKALLACIVRTIPPGSGGRIRISSTLPNRLGKMLAPLHWHDYKKKYGKLDEFVANHPELFVIDGDFIQLREGAQEIIAATAAAAKLAAAAAAPSSYSPLLPPMAVTPMPQNHRLKRAPSVEPTSEKAVFRDYAVVRPANSSDNLQSQISNGASFNGNVKLLTKPRDQMELNVSETRAASSVQLAVGNGANADKYDMDSSQNKGSSHGRRGANVVSKQGRNGGISSGSRR